MRSPPFFETAEDLADAITTSHPNATLITVDGFGRAGKTRLAVQLAPRLRAAWLDLDDFLIKYQDRFVGALRMEDLSRPVRDTGRRLVLSGCCIREVLDILGRSDAVHVYVKHISGAARSWFDEVECSNEPLPGGRALDWELWAYHQRYKPHQTADYEYHALHSESE